MPQIKQNGIIYPLYDKVKESKIVYNPVEDDEYFNENEK